MILNVNDIVGDFVFFQIYILYLHFKIKKKGFCGNMRI